MDKRTEENTIVFFIDESGTRDFNDPDCDLFCYAAVTVPYKDMNLMRKELIRLKKNYFNGNAPEIKSNWLRRKDKQKKYYLDPYDISERGLNAFVINFYSWLSTKPIHVLGSVVNKPKLRKKYKYPFYVSSFCYELLLQRAADYATQYDCNVVIAIDDISGKSPGGYEWKKLLMKRHNELIAGNSQLYKGWKHGKKMNYSSIHKKIYFLSSEQNNLIQIADICAYNIFRQARTYGKNFDQEPFYDHYKRILSLMHRDPDTNKIYKYGVIVFP